MSEHNRRKSDLQLVELRQDISDISARLDRHEENEEHWRDEYSNQQTLLIEAVNSNSKANEETSAALLSLAADTKDIVQLHKDFQATARIGSKVENMMVKLGKLGAVGVFIAGVIMWALNHVKT